MLLRNQLKNKKLIYWVTGICLLFLLGLVLLPVICSSGRLKSELESYVDEVTDHKYNLTFSDFHFNPLTGKLSLDSLKLISRNRTGSHYSIKTVNTTLKGTVVDLLFFRGDLKIRKLLITGPLVEIYTEEGNKKKITKEELFDQLQAFFGKQIKKITIKGIEIKDAEIKYYQLTEDSLPFRSVRNFDLIVDGFDVDSRMIMQREKLFQADKIELKVHNFNRMLGDNRHQLHMDELIYSMQNKKVRGKNIRISPRDTITAHGTLYWVSIPAVELESEELSKFTGSDTIRIKSLDLKQSEIRIRPYHGTNGTKLQKSYDFDLYQLFKNDFQLIDIQNLSMESTRLRIDSGTGNDSIYQELKTVKIDMNGFRLDSTAWMNPFKILYSDNLQLTVGSYLLKFNDRVHQFSAANIFASSKDSLIQAGHFNLVPVDTCTKLPATVNLSCDSIRLRSVDFVRLFHHRQMSLHEIAAFKPAVTINQFGKPVVRSKDHYSLLYHFIGNYIKGIYARIVVIENGHLTINDLQNKADPGIIEAGFNFRLTDFSIDSITARQTEKLFYATNLDVSFSDYNMKLADKIHRLKIEQIDVSSLENLVAIKNLHLFPDNQVNIPEAMNQMKRTELYHIKVPDLTLHHTDINQAFFSKKLKVSHFSIIRPDIYVELFGHMKITNKREQRPNNFPAKAGISVHTCYPSDRDSHFRGNASNLHEAKKQEKESNLLEFYELLNNYIAHIEIGQIEAPDGQLRFVNHSRKGKTIDLTNKFSLHLEHFVLNDDELNKDRLLFSDNFELKLKDHLFKLSDNVHLLKAKEVSLSSGNASVSVSDALLYPLISSPAYKSLPWHLQIKIPLITLNQVDMKQIYFSQILRVGSISINSPVIEIYRNFKKANKLNFKDLAIPLPEEMKELTVGKASMKNGKLIIYKYTPAQRKLIAGSDIDFLIEQGSLKRAANGAAAKFSSTNIETKLKGFYLSPENIPYSLNAEEIDFSSQKGLLRFTGLDIRATNTGREKMVAGIRIPSLSFEQLDPVDAFQNNRFHAGLIYSERPVFILNTIEREATKNPLFIKLPPDIQPLMDELSSEKVTIKDASFIFQQNGRRKEHLHINAVLDRFRLDSIRSEKPLGADNLLVYRDDNQFVDKMKHYDFQVDRISFTGHKSALSFSGIKILPRYSREAYQKIISHQTDHYSGSIEKIDLTGIDLDRWFEKHELKGTNILVSQLQINVYMDKRTPFNEKQRRVMPQKLIKKIEFPFFFDSVNVSDAAITYAEQSENLTGPGIVRFSKLNGHLFPFSNQQTGLNTRSNITLTANGLLMNASTLRVRMDFDMNSPSSLFTVKGSLSPFQLDALNPITEFNTHVMIRSGDLNRFDFNFRADSVSAIGKLWFAYDDLRISILEQKNGDTKEARWLSFLANNLMLKSKNPRTKTLIPDDIYYERDPKRSIINYWWKTIFSGAKNTFGIKNEE